MSTNLASFLSVLARKTSPESIAAMRTDEAHELVHDESDISRLQRMAEVEAATKSRADLLRRIRQRINAIRSQHQ